VSIFSKDEAVKTYMKLNRLAVTICANDSQEIADICRWFIQAKPIDNDMIRFYNVALAGSSDAVDVFASSAIQKSLSRHLKSVTSAAKNWQALDFPVLHSLYGHVLVCTRRF
jgi:hypothetical protein